jgi:hypothetical protein
MKVAAANRTLSLSALCISLSTTVSALDDFVWQARINSNSLGAPLRTSAWIAGPALLKWANDGFQARTIGVNDITHKFNCFHN